VVHLDVQQNLDEQILDEIQPFPDEEHLLLVGVVVGVELRHQLKMDCFQDVVGVELRHQLKMDCFQDVVPLELEELASLHFQLRALQPHS
jgi:hypothetical protein